MRPVSAKTSAQSARLDFTCTKAAASTSVQRDLLPWRTAWNVEVLRLFCYYSFVKCVNVFLCKTNMVFSLISNKNSKQMFKYICAWKVCMCHSNKSVKDFLLQK